MQRRPGAERFFQEDLERICQLGRFRPDGWIFRGSPVAPCGLKNR